MSLEPQNLSLIALKVELKKKGLDVAGTREDLVSRLAAVLPPPAAPPAAPLPAPAAPTSSPTAASSGVEAHPSNPQFVAGRDPSDPSLVPFKPGATASDPRKEENKKEEKRETAGDSKGSDSEGHRKMLKDNPDKIHTGVCRWYIPKRGYGFITPSEGDPSDLFCHQSEIYSNEFRALEPGEPVEFKLALATNGKVVAVSVTGPSGQPVRSGSRPPDYYHQIPDEEEERFRREEFLYGRRRRREDSYDEYYGYPRGGSAPGPGGYRTIHVADGARMDLPRPMSEEEKEVYKKAGPNMTETDDRPICKGKVKTFNTRKGFGFIIQDDDKTKELFVHETQIHAAGLRTLVEGESVEYRLGDGEKGKVAQRVTGPNGAVVSTNEPLQLPSEWTGPKGKERERRDRWERRDGRDRRRKRDGAERKDATEDKEKGKTYYCAICAVSLSGDQPLADHNKGKKHMRLTMAAKQSGGEIYRCVDCNKSFSNRGDMQRHMEGKHPGVTAQEVVSAVSESQQSSAPSDPSKPTTIPSVGFTQIETTVQSSVGPQARQSESSKKKKKKKKQRLVGASVNFVASSENGGTSGTVTSTTTTTTTPTTLSPAAVKMVLDNTPLKPEEMKCEICNVPFTGRLQREQHLKGRKHQSKVNGAPPPTPGGGWRGKRKYGAPGPTSPAPYYPPAGAYNPYPSSAYYKPYPAYYAPYPPTGPASSPPPTSVPPAPAAGSVPSTINYPYPPYSSYPPSSYSPYPMTTGGGSAPST